MPSDPQPNDCIQTVIKIRDAGRDVPAHPAPSTDLHARTLTLTKDEWDLVKDALHDSIVFGEQAGVKSELLAALQAQPETPVPAHEHDFQEFTVCRVCGKTPAAIEGCHHCNEPTKMGICAVSLPTLTKAQRAEFEELLAEGIHTAFRKASSHPEAHRAWQAIRDLPGEDWGRVIKFVSRGIFRKVGR